MRRGDGSLYDVRVAGFKANLADVLAAVALCQLDKIDAHTEIRRRHVEAYDAAVADLPGIRPLARDSRDRHSLHLYVVRIDPKAAGADRDAYQRALAEENIGTSIHFLPVHQLTYYRERFPDQPALPVAERAGREVLSLPLSPAHSEEDIVDAIDALRRVHASLHAVKLSRPVKVGLQLAVSGGLILYLVWRIDLRQTLDLIGSSNGWDLLAAFTIFVVTTAGMAWRWQVLLASKGIHERLAWLTKLYFISYAAGQVLPDGDRRRRCAHHRARPPPHRREE